MLTNLNKIINYKQLNSNSKTKIKDKEKISS